MPHDYDTSGWVIYAFLKLKTVERRFSERVAHIYCTWEKSNISNTSMFKTENVTSKNPNDSDCTTAQNPVFGIIHQHRIERLLL